jgi:polyisoprenyl-phosphate glycosyltransferase
MALISVVVPVYYNAESLPTLLARLGDVAREIPDAEFEWLFVDDGSGDDSFSVLQALARGDERVRVVRLSRNFGSNAAILAGLTYCRGDCAVVISADLQDPPETIHELVAAWRQGGQVVLAARRSRDDPVVPRLLATAFNRLFRRLVFRDYPPDGFDFMLLDRRVVDVLVRLQEKNSFIFGQAMWVGFRRRVVYYDRVARAHGESRWTTAKKIKYFIDAFTAFSYVPLRAASLLGLGLAGLGFLYAAVILLLRLTADIPVEGWASLSVIILVTSGTQLLLVGLLGEYLWRVLDETRRRPPFLVAEVVNLDDTPSHAAFPSAVHAARE